MSEELPGFPYRPDPLATGAVVASSTTCLCCGRARGSSTRARCTRSRNFPTCCAVVHRGWRRGCEVRRALHR
ncbi:CbrC family protein [Streptomyces sp. P9-A2]|uniref:CbrC family protein n=1 Tax=Streptomyces sp. P9-A2 TaxID=3072284 RepID=UPI002FC5A173